MGVVWHKVWRDLANNKARTGLVVISTAVGVLALGLVFGLSGVMRARLTAVHREAVPAHIVFQGGPFSPEIVQAIGRERGVSSAEGEIVVPIRWKFADGEAVRVEDGQQGWRDGQLVVRADYDRQRMELLRLSEGSWPGGREPHTAERVVGIDRLSAMHFGADLGTAVLIESGQRGRRAALGGVVYDYDVLSPAWGGVTTFYTTREDLSNLADYAYGEDFDRLYVRLNAFSRRAAEEAAQRIKDRLERADAERAGAAPVDGYEIIDPGVHPMQELVDAVMVVLGVMGGLSLGLSAFLIVNVVSAILARQVRQIGVMKAVGATLLRIVRVYLAMTLIYGALALLLAVPVGVVGAHLVAIWLLGMFNVTLGAFQFDPLAVLIQSGIALAVPPAAAFFPVLNAARITVRQAVDDHGLDGTFGQSDLDRLVSRIRGLPRTVALGLRNTFRHKKRGVLTLIMLVLSGAMFVTVMSTQAALNSTFHVIFELDGDVVLSLEHPHRAARLVETAREVPGAAHVEVWHESAATLSLDDKEMHVIQVQGVPAGSTLFNPRIIAGRNLESGDGRAILVNNRLVEEEGVAVGQEITLEFAGEESEWAVVGSYLSLDILRDVCFVPRAALGWETHTRGEGATVKVLSSGEGVRYQQQLIENLTRAFEAQNIAVTDSYSASQQWEESRSAFGILIYLLLAMATLLAMVGSIGLMSTMSINVVERTREIGVMRALGATPPIIVAVFIVEGVFIGVLSWLLAVPVSVPGAYALGAAVGQAMIRIPLDFAYSVDGLLLWLLIVSALSALASVWPALRATRVSVREALEYE
jgi:putative ABC transport system permease protein